MESCWCLLGRSVNWRSIHPSLWQKWRFHIRRRRFTKLCFFIIINTFTYSVSNWALCARPNVPINSSLVPKKTMKRFGGSMGIGRRTHALGISVMSSKSLWPPDSPGFEHGTFSLVGVMLLLGCKRHDLRQTFILLICPTCFSHHVVDQLGTPVYS